MLKNQVILITGCSSGIGRALSLELAARGHRVYASARRPETLEDLKSKGIDAVALDVNDGESIKAAVHLVHEDAGRLDMVVNNAGFSLVGPLAEVGLEDFRRELETNVVGPVALAQAAIPHMARQGSGRIVNVGSTVGILPTPFAGAYCASKSAIHMLSEVMRIELAPFGIDVILVAPGAIESNFGENAKANASLGKYREDSLYRSVADKIERRAGASQERPTPTVVFARKMADEILAERPQPFVFIGNGSTLGRVVTRTLPRRLLDRVLSRSFGLDKLRK